ncbi:uncharacterized protein GJ701_003408 isoform 2-T2 [Geothlypis trichas]
MPGLPQHPPGAARWSGVRGDTGNRSHCTAASGYLMFSHSSGKHRQLIYNGNFSQCLLRSPKTRPLVRPFAATFPRAAERRWQDRAYATVLASEDLTATGGFSAKKRNLKNKTWEKLMLLKFSDPWQSPFGF